MKYYNKIVKGKMFWVYCCLFLLIGKEKLELNILDFVGYIVFKDKIKIKFLVKYFYWKNIYIYVFVNIL